MADGTAAHLPLKPAASAIGRCLLTSARLLLRRRIRQPTGLVGREVSFADGSTSTIYRETCVHRGPTVSPALLVVTFQLRGVRGDRAHALFRAESLLNTPLFVGFRGFVSKLWMAHDQAGRYRGIYEWDDPELADAYARALWWALAVVCIRSSIHYVVVPGLRRDSFLAGTTGMGDDDAGATEGWWRITESAERPR
jgi:hypothetical protein